MHFVWCTPKTTHYYNWKTQRSLPHTITYIHQKTLPSINGWGPGPTNSRRCTFTWHYLKEATDPICFSTHVWCKPALDYCLLRSCKTSKQHSLLHCHASSPDWHESAGDGRVNTTVQSYSTTWWLMDAYHRSLGKNTRTPTFKNWYN